VNIPLLIAASIIGIAIVIGGLLAGGRYETTIIPGKDVFGTFIYQVDKLTGTIRLCRYEGGEDYLCRRGGVKDVPMRGSKT
jgi:hypothetical protein